MGSEPGLDGSIYQFQGRVQCELVSLFRGRTAKKDDKDEAMTVTWHTVGCTGDVS